MDTDGKLIMEMIRYYESDPKRVGHFLKVYGYAKTIGEAEALSPQLEQILEIAAIVHDIGIKASLKKYKSSAGRTAFGKGHAGKIKVSGRTDRTCLLSGGPPSYVYEHQRSGLSDPGGGRLSGKYGRIRYGEGTDKIRR